MKLKTLNEIGEYNDFKNTDIFTDIKAEGIKWIKEYEGIVGVDWKILFKKFYNITEEDLQ